MTKSNTAAVSSILSEGQKVVELDKPMWVLANLNGVDRFQNLDSSLTSFSVFLMFTAKAAIQNPEDTNNIPAKIGENHIVKLTHYVVNENNKFQFFVYSIEEKFNPVKISSTPQMFKKFTHQIAGAFNAAIGFARINNPKSDIPSNRYDVTSQQKFLGLKIDRKETKRFNKNFRGGSLSDMKNNVAKEVIDLVKPKVHSKVVSVNPSRNDLTIPTKRGNSVILLRREDQDKNAQYIPASFYTQETIRELSFTPENFLKYFLTDIDTTSKLVEFFEADQYSFDVHGKSVSCDEVVKYMLHNLEYEDCLYDVVEEATEDTVEETEA